MQTASFYLLLLVVFASLLLGARAQSCLLQHSFNGVQKSSQLCQNLPQQGASLAWTLDKNVLNVIFTSSAPSASGWVGWGLNLGSTPVMVGADTFIAFRSANGSNNLLTYKITPAIYKSLPTPGAINLTVLDKAAEIHGAKMSMYVSIKLPHNMTTINHIWNRGNGMSNLSPLPHSPTDTKSAGKINIASGRASATALPHQKLKHSHGIVNVVGWGILLPIGVMSARYLRSFKSADPAWFYIHSFCQSSGYVLGVVGWATGLKLGSYTIASFHKHRNLGISIFAFSTLQIFSLLLRPKKDHKIRKYWNVYHHTIGYATIAMAIVNIFEGLHILQPGMKWKVAYIGVISSLGGLSLILEAVTWIVYFQQRKPKSPVKRVDGVYGASSFGLPPQNNELKH